MAVSSTSSLGLLDIWDGKTVVRFTGEFAVVLPATQADDLVQALGTVMST